MPKKTRRVRSHSPRLQKGQSEPAPSAVTHAQIVRPEVISREAGLAATTSGGRRVDFSAEYHYIIGDLRKMALIAASMFVVLVALSFLIR